MSLRDQFMKAAGLFVEVDAETGATAPPATLPTQTGPAKTVEHLVREAAGPNLEDITVSASTLPPILQSDGKLDFSTLYQQAGVPAVPFSAEQTLDMLSSLPNEIPIDTKRQTVRATLSAMGKAIGASPEIIVTDASRKLAALTAYVDSLQKQATEFSAATELEIVTLQAQITEKRKAVDAARQQHLEVAKICHKEADRLDDVLEFFSLDVPPSKYAAEKNSAG
ncbi:MAG TPA: hypothetical protein VGL77_00575 [Armatimonadota bacterium]|jgi:hypothetical protein